MGTIDPIYHIITKVRITILLVVFFGVLIGGGVAYLEIYI